ncbi:ABC transporter permease [Noviherbaspirillum denitrificans]|uniref:Multidrug ABC transporter substrate-binding protein n=1 Tax=Noviherbaspirillum denitrificans TaxID=1968433 RepID=A0A254T8A4_9BURK|nr:FtsX-like permease family protein [Noviherbaspirillum denitrificans]OWW18880.1 multidrug ABC transporter substrate-binding protein [Noviherbaspirillum denitrificans]
MTRINAFTLALKSLRHKPLSTAVNLVLMAVGVAMMSFVLSASQQLEERALRDANGIDLVVGAKGSPLQLILSSIYHIDIPTGNIPLATAADLQKNRMVKKVIPLALGDSFKGFRIVGTTSDYIAHYSGEIAQGKMFDAPMQAVLGAQAAANTGLTPGGRFIGSHGIAGGGDGHGDAPFTVTGVLKPTGSVLDRLVLTPVESVWHMHEGHGASHDEEEKDGMDEERELTALLVQYASPLAAAMLPRAVNSQPGLQAAQPAFESAKLFRMLGVGVDVLRGIAGIMLLSAALSMFVALYSALEERKTDLAILRTLGAPPRKLLSLLLVEGLLLASAGAALGWLAGHAALEILGRTMSDGQNLTLDGWHVAQAEAWLVPVALAIGFTAALLPALRAYRTDIATTLSH